MTHFAVQTLIFCLIFVSCYSSRDTHDEPLSNTQGQTSLSGTQIQDGPPVVSVSERSGNVLNSSLSQSQVPASEPAPNVPLVQVSPGIRAGTMRYHVGDGFFYHRQRAGGGRIYLRCVNQRSNPPCRVRAVMHEDHSQFYTTAGVHNHGPDGHFDRVVRLRASILEACRVRPNVRVELLYHDVCRNVPRNVSNRVSLLSIRPSMVRAQSEHRPNIPHTFGDLAHVLENDAEIGMTLDGEERLYQGITGPPGHSSVVFFTQRVLHGIGAIQTLFCDGTFYARPNLPDSAQLFTLVSVRDNHIIPLVHALMESRTAEAYQALFNFVRNLVPTLDPAFILSDFETAQQLSLREAFPRARLVGCLWHFCRAICRNVRSLGLHQLVSNDDNARRVVRLCMAIPLAPPGRLQEALNNIIIEARRLVLFNEFADLFNYIQNTWIMGVGDATLSVFGVRHRTNNVAESHHRNLNSHLVRRPNIWRFLEMLRENEDTAWRDLGRLELGYPPSRARRVSSIMSDVRIRSCSRQVMQREMQMLQFLSTVSWRLDGVLRDFFQEVPDDRPQSPERGPPANQRLENPARCEVLPNSPSNPLQREHEMDPDFEAQLSSTFIGETIVSSQANGYNRLSVDDLDRYESLMEDPNINPDDPPQGGQNRGRGRGRGRAPRTRGSRATRGPRASRGSRGTGSTGSTRGNSRTQNIQPSQSVTGPPSSGHGTQSRNNNIHQSANENRANDPAQVVAGTLQERNSNAGIQQVNLRPENFSDAEDVPEDGEVSECIICRERIGHYAMITCGATPICGSCLRHWFVNMRNVRCLHCGGPVQGWVRLRRH